MSNKDKEKKSASQPIFKQLMDFLPMGKFNTLALQHKTDCYYKAFDAWTQLTTMPFGILSRCDSMGAMLNIYIW